MIISGCFREGKGGAQREEKRRDRKFNGVGELFVFLAAVKPQRMRGTSRIWDLKKWRKLSFLFFLRNIAPTEQRDFRHASRETMKKGSLVLCPRSDSRRVKKTHERLYKHLSLKTKAGFTLQVFMSNTNFLPIPLFWTIWTCSFKGDPYLTSEILAMEVNTTSQLTQKRTKL